MKKFLFTIIPMFMLFGCALDAKEQLPEPSSKSYTVTLNASNSTLTTSDSAEVKRVSLEAKEDSSVKYEIEIGFPAYLKTLTSTEGASYTEIIVKNGGFFRSVSSYKVAKIACDIYEGKGINYEVHNKKDGSGEALERHVSSLTPVYAEDNGAVYEYEINGNEWSITNNSVYKPAFYSVTIYFEVE